MLRWKRVGRPMDKWIFQISKLNSKEPSVDEQLPEDYNLSSERVLGGWMYPDSEQVAKLYPELRWLYVTTAWEYGVEPWLLRTKKQIAELAWTNSTLVLLAI